MPKPIPFPIHLLSNKTVDELTPLQFGILMRFLKGFWENGTGIPKNQIQLYNYTRCYFKQWNRIKADILVAWDKVIDGFKEEKDRILLIRTESQVHCAKMRSVRKPLKKQANEFISDKDLQHEKITPVPPAAFINQYNPGRFDANDRAKAIQAKKDDTGKTFKD